MSLLRVLFAPASPNVVVDDVWARCAQARALSARAGREEPTHCEPPTDDPRLVQLRLLGWSTVNAPAQDTDKRAA